MFGKHTFLAAVAFVLVGQGAQAMQAPSFRGQPVVLAGGADFFARRGDSFTCTASRAAFDAAGLPRGNSIAVLRELDSRARQNFRYRNDPPNPAAGGVRDSWHNRAAAVLSGARWQGDCDDLAITTLALAICGGASRGNVGLAFVQTDGGPADPSSADHMVAWATDAAGTTWIMGDTFGPMRKAPAHLRKVIWADAKALGAARPRWQTAF